MKNLFVIALAFILVGAGCYTFKKQEDYYGISTRDKNVVFVLDISGSMENINEPSIEGHIINTAVNQSASAVNKALGGGALGSLAAKQLQQESTKLGAAKRELIPTLKGLDAHATFSIITFESAVKSWRSTPVEAVDGNKTNAVLFVNGLKAGGATSAKAALKTALAIAGADVIFFLTDGQPTDSRPEDILKMVSAANPDRKVTIHTIGVGQDQDETFLRELAAQNKGQYYRSKF